MEPCITSTAANWAAVKRCKSRSSDAVCIEISRLLISNNECAGHHQLGTVSTEHTWSSSPGGRTLQRVNQATYVRIGRSGATFLHISSTIRSSISSLSVVSIIVTICDRRNEIMLHYDIQLWLVRCGAWHDHVLYNWEAWRCTDRWCDQRMTADVGEPPLTIRWPFTYNHVAAECALEYRIRTSIFLRWLYTNVHHIYSGRWSVTAHEQVSLIGIFT